MSRVVVLKFGGAALATTKRLLRAARRVARWRDAGHAVVVVASARGRSTDLILRQAERVDASWHIAGRELDRALACGELLSSSLLAAVLLNHGVPAHGLSGAEAGILAAGEHGRGHVLRVLPQRLDSLLGRGVVPVVAGFQAGRPDGETITLGRGTSDLSAAHLAVALGAPTLHLIKDVDGVHVRDPHADADAPLLEYVDYDQMERMALGGAEVLHVDAVRLARRCELRLRVYHHRARVFDAGGTTVGPTQITPAISDHGGLACLPWI